MSYKLELKTAKEAVLFAGKVLMRPIYVFFNEFIEPKDILNTSGMTSQSIILNIIKKAFPNDKILTEEDSCIFDNTRMWVTDPLDVTINFSRDMPFLGVSVALFENGEAKLGVTYLPVFNELYYAVKGEGCYCNGKKINVSNTKNKEKIKLKFNDFNIGSGTEIEKFDSNKLGSIRKGYDNCKGLKNFSFTISEFACVASGKIDVYIMIFCSYWDIAVGILMIEEAGGKVSVFKGNVGMSETKFVIASNGILHNYYVDMVKGTGF